MKALLVNVLKDNLGDCTAGGATSGQETAYLLNDRGPFNVEPDENGFHEGKPVLKVSKNGLGGMAVAPLNDKRPGSVGPMFGGNFVYGSDSRFPHSYPLHVFDRFETPETYRKMSI